MLTRQQAIAKLIAEGAFELTAEDGRGYPMRVFRHAPRSLRSVLEESRVYGDLPHLVYYDEVLTFRQHYAQVAALAQHLQAVGVKKGDRVALGMRNLPEWPVGFWACQAIGAIVVSLNAWWTGDELQFALTDSEPVALLLDGKRLERLRPYVADLNLRTMVITRRGEAGEGGIDLSEILAKYADADLPDVELAPDDLATILYTSGTTGKPKGAAATHRNHITNMMQSLLSGAAGRLVGGMAAELTVPTQATQPGTLQIFPFFHMAGFGGQLVALATGGKVVLMYKWSAPEGVDLIEKHRISSIAGVPLVVRQLLEEATRLGRSLETLTYIGSGGAPVPPDLIDRIGKQFSGRVLPGNGYGLTETTSGVITNSGLEYLAHPDSVGRPQVTADIRVVRDDGQVAERGEIGEIWVRGPNVIPGYWRDPTGTAAAFSDGWFRSGDLGYVDKEGLYYVVDRKKDVIIRGGENVYCAEVESALVAQPEVRDAAVFGLPHAVYGEEVAVVIQLAGGLRGEVIETLLERLAQRLARFKIPTVVRVCEAELPRNAVGKVLKRELKAQYFPERLTVAK